ncbi:4'-phosphopantetheinyl transferase superfamily protein [Adlercreutzia sp. ZJ138]|uniref:4'-phosphopantetheinyl transferase family protein n=1 Tax=Adlercreutzia sp. ZJ138 TaxID=2709405 RepID=UPI0013EBBBB6|nr:hypothetical protein [Adlercreutzia sp. ZJ138]
MRCAYLTKTANQRLVWVLLDYAFFLQFGFRAPKVEKLPCGKPVFAGCMGVHFSVSHTKGCVMVVLSDSPCGCDIELSRVVPEGMLSKVSSVEERQSFTPLEIWTLKESAVKLAGEVSDGDVYQFMADTRFERVGRKLILRGLDNVQAITTLHGNYQVAMLFEGKGMLPNLIEIGERTLFEYGRCADVGC